MAEVAKSNLTDGFEERVKLMKKSLINLIDNIAESTVDFQIELFNNFKTTEEFEKLFEKKFRETVAEFVVSFQDIFHKYIMIITVCDNLKEMVKVEGFKEEMEKTFVRIKEEGIEKVCDELKEKMEKVFVKIKEEMGRVES